MIETFPVRLSEKGPLLTAKPTGRLDKRGQWTYTVYRDNVYHGVYAEDVLVFHTEDEDDVETTKEPQTVYHSAGIPSLNTDQNKYTVISYRVFGHEDRETRYFYTLADTARIAIANVLNGEDYRDWYSGNRGSTFYPVVAVLLDWVEDAVLVER